MSDQTGSSTRGLQSARTVERDAIKPFQAGGGSDMATVLAAGVVDSGTEAAGYTVTVLNPDGSESSKSFAKVRNVPGECVLAYLNGPNSRPVLLAPVQGMRKGRIVADNGDGTYDVAVRDWEDTEDVATLTDLEPWPPFETAPPVNQEVWLVYNAGSIAVLP